MRRLLPNLISNLRRDPATASYRLLPHIKIKKPIPPQFADKFAKCFSPGVIKVDPRTKEVSVDEHSVRKDTVSREVFRHPEFADSVELSRVRDFFLCVYFSFGVLALLLIVFSSQRRVGRSLCT